MAQNDPPIVGNRVALKGYDPVSYVAEGKPEKGSSEFTFALDDTTYWFKSAEQQDKFRRRPRALRAAIRRILPIQLSRGRQD